jgi:hypothetical protein
VEYLWYKIIEKYLFIIIIKYFIINLGTHDQGWAERAVFGKIRYMNYDGKKIRFFLLGLNFLEMIINYYLGCKRKFDIERFITKYYAKKSLV